MANRVASVAVAAVVLAAVVAGCGHGGAVATSAQKAAFSNCLSLPQGIVADVNNLGTDKRLTLARGKPRVTCAEALRDDRHPTGTLPFVGARLMTLTSVLHPRGVLVWVVASTPGPAIPIGGPLSALGRTEPPRSIPRYAFSVDFIAARTGRYLEGLEGS